MGIDRPAIVLLSGAKRIGVDFSSTVMIGRQNFVGHIEPAIRRLFELHRLEVDAREFSDRNHFCEELFTLLGAKQVESIDFSDYEQATHIHDMNQPIPASFHERYSCVQDGGSIEHVFNIPQALKNCLQMVQLGGHFVQVNMANNYMGHGFWQLSPELIYRTMSPENGFEVQAVLLHEAIPGGVWRSVADPGTVGGRVELCNSHPTFIMTIAKRTAIKDIFATTPQQSDYVGEWKDAPRDLESQMKRVRRPMMRRVLTRVVKRILNRPRLHVYDPRHYRRISEDQVWNGDVRFVTAKQNLEATSR